MEGRELEHTLRIGEKETFYCSILHTRKMIPPWVARAEEQRFVVTGVDSPPRPLVAGVTPVTLTGGVTGV